MKTLVDAPDAHAAKNEKTVVAFVHIEPADVQEGSNAENKLVKNSKWLARKWKTMKIVLHSFTHLGEKKAEAYHAEALLKRAGERLETAG
jgi:hypothetical protein